MNRLFVETDTFRSLIDSIKEYGLEKKIKDEILKDPEKGDVIQGTGGLRKIRVAKEGQGKSGGYRVIYLDLKAEEVTYLFLVYGKNVQDNLTGQQKNILASQVEELKNAYKKRK